MASGRRSRADVRSDRSADAYKLELQPDDSKRPSTFDYDDDELYSGEDDLELDHSNDKAEE